jgi:PAS domain S-box-containing protein
MLDRRQFAISILYATVLLAAIASFARAVDTPSASSSPDPVIQQRLGPTWVALGACFVASLVIVFYLRLQARHGHANRRRELDLEAENRDLIENANDVIFTLDRDMRIVAFNRAGERLTGFSREEIIGRRLSDLSPPRSEATEWRQSANELQTFELPIRTRDGRTQIWDVSARPALRSGVLAVTNCIARDITERKRAHEERRRLYMIQAQQFDQSPLAVIETDGSFRIVRWSKQAERIFGWTAAEAAGKSFDELNIIHAEDADRVRATFRELVDGASCNSSRNRNNTKSGGVVHVEWYNSALRDESGRLICVMSMGHDVTARQRDEEERRRLENQVRQSQKMEAVGLLAGGIAHDFNNLLTVINGCSELIRVQSESSEAVCELAGEIQQAGEQAATLTRQLLAFSRRQITAPKSVDLNDVVRDVERLLRRLIGEHIVFTVDLEARGAMVKVDPGLMVQMFMNLAVNARDAMPQGGELTIRTRLARDRVMVEVCDTGMGMEVETRSRIFEPFFTTKPLGEGTGIGLATVHGIVEQSKGTIVVESELGRGTTFRIELPACVERPPSKQTIHVHHSEMQLNRTVLLVEDEDLVRSLAARVLESRGYCVHSASCGVEALELHSRINGSIDVLLTDVVMPGLGGRQLAEQLRARQPELRVLFMSGYTTDDVLRQGIQAEEVHFLQKPFTPDELARKVRDVLQVPIEQQLALA